MSLLKIEVVRKAENHEKDVDSAKASGKRLIIISGMVKDNRQDDDCSKSIDVGTIFPHLALKEGPFKWYANSEAV